MGKDPGLIFKQISAKAIHRSKQAISVENENILTSAHDKTGAYYLFYKDVIKAFMLEGYTDTRAEKYIAKWIDYDLANVLYEGSYKLLGFYESEVMI